MSLNWTEQSLLSALLSYPCRTAADAAHQHVLAEAEEGLATRASVLAEEVSLEADRIDAVMALAAPMAERLVVAANTAISAARLQMACVGICVDQGTELSTMHAAMGAVRGIAGRIQERMEAAERQARSGQALEAAEVRGQAAALQAALQSELQTVQASRKKLVELETRMRASQQELQLVGGSRLYRCTGVVCGLLMSAAHCVLACRRRTNYLRCSVRPAWRRLWRSMCIRRAIFSSSALSGSPRSCAWCGWPLRPRSGRRSPGMRLVHRKKPSSSSFR